MAICKHCDADSHLPGLHHKMNCPRYTSDPTAPLDDAFDCDCMYCNVRPYTPGYHHDSTCPRYMKIESVNMLSHSISKTDYLDWHAESTLFKNYMSIPKGSALRNNSMWNSYYYNG
ncbi:MAG: hypothetical protein EPO37_02165 [Nitrosarchaeum sp.]|nr:MAG: hypothetical protein EPO37_02165 [Nitrosarchaeum sp.]